MKIRKEKQTMLIPIIIMGLIAAVLTVIAFNRGQGEHIAGFKSAMDIALQIIPMLIFAIIIAGMLQSLLPHDAVEKWIGGESGMRGILLGTVAGALMPGGPYISLPIAAGLLRAGAGIGTMVAFITGWSLWAIARLPLEIGVLGWKFTLIKIASTFFFPPIAGIIAKALFDNQNS